VKTVHQFYKLSMVLLVSRDLFFIAKLYSYKWSQFSCKETIKTFCIEEVHLLKPHITELRISVEKGGFRVKEVGQQM